MIRGPEEGPTTRQNRLLSKLNDPGYRHAYADEHLNLTVSTQLKVLREDRGLTQRQLAEMISTKQAGISRLESVDYSSWNVATLRKIAEAFDVRLRITFEEFGTLWPEVATFSKEVLSRRSFKDDPGCRPTKPVESMKFTTDVNEDQRSLEQQTFATEDKALGNVIEFPISDLERMSFIPKEIDAQEKMRHG